MTDEEQMIQDVLNGRKDSFRWIIERYQQPVFRMIFNLIHNRHAAEDVTQEVFMTVYQKLSRFDPMLSRFSTWVFTIARNKSINVLREMKQPILIDLHEIALSEKSGEQADDKEIFQCMDYALNQLPLRQKRAFVLAEFENLPYDQIAQIECISIGTVKSRIHRAKQKLQKALKQISGDE